MSEVFFTIDSTQSKEVIPELTVLLRDFVNENLPIGCQQIDESECNLDDVVFISEAILFVCVHITKSNHPGCFDQRMAVIDKYCSNGTIINKRYFVDMKQELFFRCLERIFSNISI